MSLKANYDSLNIFLAILVNLIVIYIALKSTTYIEKILGPSGIMVVRKFFGVILLAIAVKIFKANMNVF
jgi:multiple antibiotic resistance protein